MTKPVEGDHKQRPPAFWDRWVLPSAKWVMVVLVTFCMGQTFLLMEDVSDLKSEVRELKAKVLELKEAMGRRDQK